ncbi:hypothetical protein G6731_00035 [Polynucleobacter paneuropaeus]|uniref:Galactosyltransferase C-terminal domain-containing protein n=1 Tax=Polynucleobacter paneuropaeus TaxID=2527775 RepID=A0A9Q2WHJ9_9BURK|nr:hypothetical protein [Polynucleobacter paneuropaeus]
MPDNFYNILNQILRSERAADSVMKAKLISKAYQEIDQSLELLKRDRLNLLGKVLSSLNLNSLLKKEDLFNLLPLDMPIDDYKNKTLRHGITLVNCVMNRNEHLPKVLPSWIACEEITEIVIVDWSSREPVLDYLFYMNLLHPKVKVLRVNNQQKWVLSYAFNAGFRFASCKKIVKADVDIVINPDFFKKNVLKPNSFLSGHYKIADPGQEHINGFFYIDQMDLMAVNGFNEFITTYGWDDDDIYARLSAAGVKRELIDPKTIWHIPHGDELRLGDQGGLEKNDSTELVQDLTASINYKIRFNRFLANTMPEWNQGKGALPINIKLTSDQYFECEQVAAPIIPVPAEILDDARHYATLELVSWKKGPQFLLLNKVELDHILDKRLDDLSKWDVGVLIANRANKGKIFSERAILIELECFFEEEEFLQLAELLNIYAVKNNCIILLDHLQSQCVEMLVRYDHISLNKFQDLKSHMPYYEPDFIGDKEKQFTQFPCAFIKLREWGKAILISGLKKEVENFPTSKHSLKKPKLYIDMVHGLGNRLRAFGSAASIAKKTDRELVAIWQPDDHCDCKMADIFECEFDVIEKSFHQHAECLVFNYMENEGGIKNKIIDQDHSDIYLRSAFVFNSPHTNWDSECKELRALRPTKEILEMIKSVEFSGSLGVHVRMQGADISQASSYDLPENNWSIEDHRLILENRNKSNYQRFLEEIDANWSHHLTKGIYLAADNESTYKAFKEKFGSKVIFFPRNKFDRSSEQIKSAYVDAYLLSKSQIILGSNWSSFSELAIRLSEEKVSIKYAGVDF